MQVLEETVSSLMDRYVAMNMQKKQQCIKYLINEYSFNVGNEMLHSLRVSHIMYKELTGVNKWIL